jgi:hypothetical protein
MSIEVIERKGRRAALGDQTSVDLEFLILGTDDETAALAALGGALQPFWNGLPLESSEVEEIDAGAGIFEGRAHYGAAATENEQEVSFDTAGGTAKITASRGTRGYAATGVTSIPDFKGAIGVTKDGVEGVEIPVPNLQFQVHRSYGPTIVDAAFIKGLADLTGCVNSAPFMGFDSGEVRFDGASGSRKNARASWNLAYRFAASANQANLVIGDIPNIEKYGWEYLWVLFQEYEDSSASFLVRRPLAVYVEQVLPYADFGVLGLG